MVRACAILCLFIHCSHPIKAEIWTFSLEDALSHVAQTEANEIRIIDSTINRLKHEIFNGNIYPNISLSAQLPEYDKSISLVSQYDGSYRYLQRALATSSVNLNVSQLIPFTGGTLKYSVGIDRLDNLTSGKRSYGYYLNLSRISYSQDIFSYNQYKWAKRLDKQEQIIESIKSQQQLEKIRYDIVDAFFNLLVQQYYKQLREENLGLSRYVYNKAKLLYHERRISETDFLDTEIEYLRDSLNENDDNIDKVRQSFRALLHLPEQITPTAQFDDRSKTFASLTLNARFIVDRVLEFNCDEDFNLKNLQLDIDLKKAQSEKSPTLQLNLSGGYNSQFQNFNEILKDELSSYKVSISFSVPIYNGRILSNKYRMVVAQKERLREQTELDKTNTRNDILGDLADINTTINAINSYRSTLNLMRRQLENVKLQLDYGRINVEQYVRLKNQYNQAVINYITQIRKYYIYIYKYRYLSLYDIESNTTLYEG